MGVIITKNTNLFFNISNSKIKNINVYNSVKCQKITKTRIELDQFGPLMLSWKFKFVFHSLSHSNFMTELHNSILFLNIQFAKQSNLFANKKKKSINHTT